MIPDFETLEELARRARVERSLYIAEKIADGVFALDRAMGTAWDRVTAFLRPRPAISRQPAAARR
jgi:hypothetical protein